MWRRITEGSMSKAILMSPMDFDKKNRDKKKEEEELKIRQVACGNCGDKGHSRS